MIEYKCQRNALLYNENNIGKHCEDYLAILGNIELCDVLKREIIKAYMMMRKIYGAPDLELSHKEFQINIAFLITKYPCEEKRKVGDKPLSDSDLDEAKAQLEKCSEKEEFKKFKKRIKYLICDKPEKCRLEGWKYLDEWGK